MMAADEYTTMDVHTGDLIIIKTERDHHAVVNELKRWCRAKRLSDLDFIVCPHETAIHQLSAVDLRSLGLQRIKADETATT